MKFETDKKEIIEMYNDYLYLKYYKKNVVDDIIRNVKLETSSNKKKRLIIKSLINSTEYDEYVKILKKHLNLVQPLGGNVKPYGIVYQFNLQNRKAIHKGDVIELIFDDCIIEEYVYELKAHLKLKYFCK